MEKTVHHLLIDEDQSGQRLDNFLGQVLQGLPSSLIQRIIRKGEVRVNSGRVQSHTRLKTGDRVRIPPLAMPPPEAVDSQAQVQAQVYRATRLLKNWGELPIIYEDAGLLAINKPSGLAVHGGSGVSLGVIEALRSLRPQERFLELVHRLDRDTSGVLLIARKRTALVALHAAWREGQVSKYYQTLVRGQWTHTQKHSIRLRLSADYSSGERRIKARKDEALIQEQSFIPAYSGRKSSDSAIPPPVARTITRRRTQREQRQGVKSQMDMNPEQDAHTIVLPIRSSPTMSWLEARPQTGRTHQIRVHLTALGYPIIGDDKYGDTILNKKLKTTADKNLSRLYLHAQKMVFSHPTTGERLSLEAPLPREYEQCWEWGLSHLKETD